MKRVRSAPGSALQAFAKPVPRLPALARGGSDPWRRSKWERFPPSTSRQRSEACEGNVPTQWGDVIGRGESYRQRLQKRPDQGPREKHGAWMLARLCGNAQSASVFMCTADNRIRESQHLTLIHDRTNLSFGRSRRPGSFDCTPPIRLQIHSLGFGQDIQYSDGGKKVLGYSMYV